MTSHGCFWRRLTRPGTHLRRMSPIFAGVVPTTPSFFYSKKGPPGPPAGPAGLQNAIKTMIFPDVSPSDPAVPRGSDKVGSQTVF